MDEKCFYRQENKPCPIFLEQINEDNCPHDCMRLKCEHDADPEPSLRLLCDRGYFITQASDTDQTLSCLFSKDPEFRFPTDRQSRFSTTELLRIPEQEGLNYVEKNLTLQRSSATDYSCYIFGISTFVSTLIAVGCSLMIFRAVSKLHELEQTLNSTSFAHAQQVALMCLPCDKIAQGPFEEDNVLLSSFQKKNENGVNTCCAKTPEQVSLMLNLFATRKQMEKRTEEILIREKFLYDACHNCNGCHIDNHEAVSAHLVADQQEIESDQISTFQQIKSWLWDEPGTHLSNINITDGKLIVPQTSTYFVYSQAGFQFYFDNELTRSDTRDVSLFHVVYRYNSIYPLDGSQQLLQSESTECWEKNKNFGHYSSHIGASVRLNNGDQIYVKVSPIQNLTRSPHITYFGLVRLD